MRLELDAEERDRYGRLLAYVYAGDVLVNAELLREGYAEPLAVPPERPLRGPLRARSPATRGVTGSGLWASCSS